MANPSTNSIAFGSRNSGVEIGQSHGPVSTVIHNHFPPERAETLPKPFSNVPFLPDKDHIVRNSLVNELRSKLGIGGTRVALVGLGGVGKSQIAIEHSHYVRATTSETWVLWLHASNAARFEQSVRHAVEQLKIAGRKIPQANIFTLFQGWLHDERKGPWLLVLDNADDADFLREPIEGDRSSSSQSLYGCIPCCQHGSVLITSRSRDAARQLVESGDIILVQPMAREQAIALVEKKLTEADSEDARNLAETLEFMPLAITQAAAYIKHRAPRCSIQRYVKKVRSGDKWKNILLDRNQPDLRRDDEAGNSIILTWQISFEHISQDRPSAAGLLSLMSFFDRESIPETLLRYRGDAQSAETAGRHGNDSDDEHSDDEIGSPISREDAISEISSDDELEEDIALLHSFSFISIDADARTFGMHRLVQLATQRWLETQEQLERWKCQCIHNLDAAFPGSDYKNWPVCRALYPHARSVMSLKVKPRETFLEWSSLMNKVAQFANANGAASSAQKIAGLSLAARRKLLGEEHVDVLDSMSTLAMAYKNQGHWKKAEEMELKLIEIAKRVLGEEDLVTVSYTEGLALTYRDLGRWSEAEQLGKQALNIRTKVLGEESPEALTCTANLAVIYNLQGRLDEAESREQKVLEARKRVLGKEHKDTLGAMANLAITYGKQGRRSEAQILEIQVLDRRKKILGEEHPHTLTSMANLAVTYSDQGSQSEAEELGVRGIEIEKRVLGAEHPQTLGSMGNLALVYMKQGRLSESEKLEEYLIDTMKRLLGEKHPNTIQAMANLACNHEAQGKHTSALALMTACATMSAKVLGSDHPGTRSRRRRVEEWKMSGQQGITDRQD